MTSKQWNSLIWLIGIIGHEIIKTPEVKERFQRELTKAFGWEMEEVG